VVRALFDPLKISLKTKWTQLPAAVQNIGTQGVQELFFVCEVSEIGAFVELFTVMIWLI